jgi:hypothetical protein
LNNGTGTFIDATAALLPVVSDDTHAVVLGDCDGDGDLDLIVGNHGKRVGQQNRLYLNNGAGRFSDVTATRMPTFSEATGALATGDIDGDGDLDLVVGDGYPAQQNRLYLNSGAGLFSDVTATRMPALLDTTAALALGDVDGDGDLDIVVGNRSGQQNRLYLNLLRQLDAPYVLHVGRTYQLDVYARYGPAHPSDAAMLFLSLATANIPLPPLGIVGIDPNLMVGLPSFTVPRPAGVGSLSIKVPNTPSIAGLAIHSQALLIQNPLPARLTNVNSDIILR